MKLSVRTFAICAVAVLALSAVAVARPQKTSAPETSGLYQQVNDSERVYNIRFEDMWPAVMHASYQNFEVNTVDLEKNVIDMHTKVSLASNGIHVTVSVEQVGLDKTRVVVKTAKKSSVFFWSSPNRIQRNYFKDIDEQITPKH